MADRGYRFHKIIDAVTIDPGDTQVIVHGFGREADLLTINLVSGDQRLEVLSLDEEEIEVRNPSLTETNVSDLIFEYWWSKVK